MRKYTFEVTASAVVTVEAEEVTNAETQACALAGQRLKDTGFIVEGAEVASIVDHDGKQYPPGPPRWIPYSESRPQMTDGHIWAISAGWANDEPVKTDASDLFFIGRGHRRPQFTHWAPYNDGEAPTTRPE